MNAPPPEAVANAYFAAIRAHDVEGIKQVFAPTAELVTPTGTYIGPDNIAEFYAGQAFAAPDLQPQVAEIRQRMAGLASEERR